MYIQCELQNYMRGDYKKNQMSRKCKDYFFGITRKHREDMRFYSIAPPYFLRAGLIKSIFVHPELVPAVGTYKIRAQVKVKTEFTGKGSGDVIF